MSSSVFCNVRNNGMRILKPIEFIKLFSTEAEEIKIPKRIHRSPTDILRALSNTVQRDPTAPHYKYHDDPYLIPYSNSSKRSYALSQESGRKAAQWIRQQHADLFQHKVAEPFIEVFSPKPVLDENSNVSEDILKKLIKDNFVTDAIFVYQKLEGNSIELSRETVQSLLELVCYYNAEDPLNEDWIEERWFRLGMKEKGMQRNTWRDNGIAEQLFKKLEPADSASYSAIISGMCTYGQLDKAWSLYQESIQRKVAIDVIAFNSLLAKVSFLKEGHDLIWVLLQELLTEMNQRMVSPNIGTMNAVLETLSLMASNRNAKPSALRVIAEFKQFNIEPSLATFYHLLNIFCSSKGPPSGILIDIMNYLEGKSVKVVDLKDTYFFVRAMDVCHNHLKDKDLAYRVDKFLHTEDNYNLIGDSYKESLYYRHLFTLLCKMESLDIFMKLYHTLVPNIYIPEPSVMEIVLATVDHNGAWEYLPQLWSDMVQFEHSERQNLLAKLLDCCSKNMDESLYEKMVKIGTDIWEKIEENKRERSSLAWTGTMLSDLMLIFIQGGEKNKAVMVLDKLISAQYKIMGEPRILPLQLLLDACIQDSSVNIALKCIHYCHNIGFLEVDEMAKKLYSSSTLNDSQKRSLIDIVGEETLRLNEKTASEMAES